jgi:hypothetical protein
MNEIVMVPIPVSADAAAALGDADRRARIGRLISSILRPATPADDPLAALIAAVKEAARADNLTDSEIDAELAVYNAENRL